ncbi:MAG TPA: SGNH/GDSL hydrolase family protein [Stenotrophomonas sp.]
MSASLFRALALLLFVVSPLAQAKGPAPRIPEQVSNPAWEADIARFEQTDAQSPPPRGAVVFVGSSSIRMWESLASDFPGQAVINRGFGGSEVRDSTWYADRIVLPYKPRLVVFYAGDNDLNAGRTPQQVRDDFVAFVGRVRKGLPDTRIAYISIKPSPSRAQLLPQIAEANRLVREAAGKFAKVDFLDVYTPMLDANGQPRPELFREDQLHMTADGYAIWRKVVGPELAR